MTEPLRQTFGSVTEVLDFIATPRPYGVGDTSSDEYPSESWDLGIGYAGAIDALRNGWTTGVEQASALAEHIRPRKATRMVFHNDIVGPFCDIDAYLGGDPECMLAPAEIEAQGAKFVTLCIPVAFNCDVDAQEAFNRGIAFVALLDALESSGYRVKVVAFSAIGLWNATSLEEVTLKEFQDSLDLSNLMFAAAHPAFLRRILMAVMERSPFEEVREVTMEAYGYAGKVSQAWFEDDAVVFPNLSSWKVNPPEKHLEWLTAALPEEARQALLEDDKDVG